MSRPRSFSVGSVITRAKQLFWERGYQGTAVSDLEAATGLHRSSLYQAFGSKDRLFEAALDNYVETFIMPLLRPMLAPGADRATVEGFFARLATMYRGHDIVARRGCLWVNTIAEFAATHNATTAHAPKYRVLLYDAFSNALKGGGRPPDVAERRSRMLVPTTFGLWLLVRIDAREAALGADAARDEVNSW